MKQADILKALALEFKTKDLLEVNKILKAKADEKIKFKIMGPNLGYLGFTVAIKNVTEDGVKIFDVNRVRLIRFEDIESFEKAKPKVPRPVYEHPKPKPTPKIVKRPTPSQTRKAYDDEEDDDDFEEEDDKIEEKVISKIKKKRKSREKSFIPKK